MKLQAIQFNSFPVNSYFPPVGSIDKVKVKCFRNASDFNSTKVASLFEVACDSEIEDWLHCKVYLISSVYRFFYNKWLTTFIDADIVLLPTP